MSCLWRTHVLAIMSYRRYWKRLIRSILCCKRHRGRSGLSSRRGMRLLMQFWRNRPLRGMEFSYWRRKLSKVDRIAYKARRTQDWIDIYKVAIRAKPDRWNQQHRQSHLGLPIQGSQALLPSTISAVQGRNWERSFQLARPNPELQDLINLDTK